MRKYEGRQYLQNKRSVDETEFVCEHSGRE